MYSISREKYDTIIEILYGNALCDMLRKIEIKGLNKRNKLALFKINMSVI